MKPERPISPLTWVMLPEEVRDHIEALEHAVARLMHEVQELRVRLNQNSSNSSKPPSSDPPFQKPKAPEKAGSEPRRKRGGQPGHKGHRQPMLEPTRVVDVKPAVCRCGSHLLEPCAEDPFYTHQWIELPDIPLEVVHYRLFRTRCRECGSSVKGHLPRESRTGYGPRLCAMAVQLSGPCGESRETARDFLQSSVGLPISTGGIQRIIDRASAAIEPIHDAIAAEARTAPVNHIDETSWKTQFKLQWLWVMANSKVAFFLIHSKRSYDAFLALVDVWEGILVSDDYALYRKWTHMRQACLAHLIRAAKGLAEHADPEIAWFGARMVKELTLLCHWGHDPPNIGQWNAFYARFVGLLRSHSQRRDKAGKLARRLTGELDDLWLFLWQNGVGPTNNLAERVIRFGVMWRKRSLGTRSEKGNRWVERILSLKQTCRMHGIPTFPILVQAISDHLKGEATDVTWVAQLPA